MEHTVFIQTPYTRKHKAEPYDEKGQRIDWQNSYWYKKNQDKFIAAASMHTEPLDFSNWMIAVMNQKLLSEESYQEMLKPHSEVSTTPDGLEVYYSLGFMTAGEPYQNAFFHGGNNDGFTCWYVMDIEEDWGFVLFTNSEYGEQLGNELLEYLEQ